MRFPWIFSLILLLGPLASAEPRQTTCAHDSLGLEQTPRLRELKAFFGSDYVGLVNETGGSYVVIDMLKERMTVSFYTSGLFDLVPISRTGPLEICDTGDGLVMRGIEREEALQIVQGRLVIGRGGPIKTFAKGAMPPNLAKLHRYQERSVASKP